MNSQVERHLCDLIVAEADGVGFATVSVVVRSGGRPVSACVPNGEQAFLAYSITKIFIATLVLALCERGKLALDDTIERWFPTLPNASEIRLDHLLNHTSGLGDYGGLPAYHQAIRAAPRSPWSFERFLGETTAAGPLFRPGTGWSYSNPGYMLLKRIAELTTDTSFSDLISHYIAGPLALAGTRVMTTSTDLATLAPGTSTEVSPDAAPVDVRDNYHPGWVSHGVVASTSADIVRFLDALFSFRLLQKASVDRMLTGVPVSDSGGPDVEDPLLSGRHTYGLGLMLDDHDRRGLLAGHNGGGPCYSASAFHSLRLGASVCVMGAIEERFHAERVVAQAFTMLMQGW